MPGNFKRVFHSRFLGVILSVMCITISPVLFAQEEEPRTYLQDLENYAASRLEYQIGGRRTTLPFLTDKLTTSYNPDLSLGWAYSACGDQDFLGNLERSFEGLSNIAEEAVQIMLFAVEGFVATLPEYLLQRLNPGLYELLTNFKLRYEDLFRLAVKSCEKLEDDIANGENPYQDFLRYYAFNKWRTLSVEAGDEGLAIDIHETVRETKPEEGMLWVNGERKGGAGQEPIAMIGDLCEFGFEALNGTTGSLRRYFTSGEGARDWCVEVLGETEMYYEEGPVEKPGRGIHNKIGVVAAELRARLPEVIASNVPLSDEEINGLSSMRYRINNKIIDILGNLPSDQRITMMERVAQDVGTSRVIEQALIVRRILLAGLKEPHVNNISPVKKIVFERYLSELDDEIKNIQFEREVHSSLHNTLDAVYELREIQKTRGSRRVQVQTPLRVIDEAGNSVDGSDDEL